jgi:hypothetical protein
MMMSLVMIMMMQSAMHDAQTFMPRSTACSIATHAPKVHASGSAVLYASLQTQSELHCDDHWYMSCNLPHQVQL